MNKLGHKQILIFFLMGGHYPGMTFSKISLELENEWEIILSYKPPV